MAKVYAMIANGTEEVECLAVVDLLRRSGVETVLVSVEESCEVTSSHKVRITADTTLAQTDLSDGDAVSYTHLDVYKRQSPSSRTLSSPLPIWPCALRLPVC